MSLLHYGHGDKLLNKIQNVEKSNIKTPYIRGTVDNTTTSSLHKNVWPRSRKSISKYKKLLFTFHNRWMQAMQQIACYLHIKYKVRSCFKSPSASPLSSNIIISSVALREYTKIQSGRISCALYSRGWTKRLQGGCALWPLFPLTYHESENLMLTCVGTGCCPPPPQPQPQPQNSLQALVES